MNINKERMKDENSRPMTIGLFLEVKYDERHSQFTLDDEDKDYNGKEYVSLKRLYLEMSDPTEYHFAKEYLLGWKHWQKMLENKFLRKHIEEWREELEVKIRSEAILGVMDMPDNFQAVKWVAEGGWNKRGRGRPKKEDQLREDKIEAALNDEFSADIVKFGKK